MEDIFKFLMIAGVIAFGIFRQFNKDKAEAAEKAPMPSPFPEYEEDPIVFLETPAPSIPKKTTRTLPVEGVRSTYTPSASVAPPAPDDPNAEDSEFSIHTAEEARRAIVWSEILQRKY